MNRIVKAHFAGGVIVPEENLDIEEGEEVTVVVTTGPKRIGTSGESVLDETCGGWKNLVDGEALKERIYKDRLVSTRTEPKI
jgi:predicted DNA-binding antitoxin AbrB/MazE fold protein